LAEPAANFAPVREDIAMKLSRLASFAAILLCVLELSGCANTARGAAKDVTTTVDAAVE
jgi:predicted small secreted protein